MQNCQAEMKNAVECGYWNLFRFNPEAAAGKKFSLDNSWLFMYLFGLVTTGVGEAVIMLSLIHI